MSKLSHHCETSDVRLWSFQNAAIVASLHCGRIHRASWTHTPENFRIAYQWMAEKLRVLAPELSDHAPVWCWHSCGGVRQQPPTVETAIALLSEHDIEQGMIVIELAVPRELMLLSSYYAWNRFLDSAIEKNRLPKSPLRERWMFQEPFFRHSDDDIQAVIPMIDPKWVRRIDGLSVNGRDSNQPAIAID